MTLVFVFRCVGDEFVSHPQQTQATHQHQARYLEQPNNANGHGRAYGNGADGAPNDGLVLMFGGKIARGKRDDDGVVASENQVNENDGEQS